MCAYMYLFTVYYTQHSPYKSCHITGYDLSQARSEDDETSCVQKAYLYSISGIPHQIDQAETLTIFFVHSIIL